MNQVNARHEIIREWRSLPKDLRQTDEQAAAFAMQIKDKYKFSSGSTDPYQTVKDWLLHYPSIMRRPERNAEGEAKMSGEKRSDAGLAASERKTLRSREAKEVIATISKPNRSEGGVKSPSVHGERTESAFSRGGAHSARVDVSI
jgi:hypothetical protein